MNRILGIFAASSVLLTACGGGGVQSPDFKPVLKGVFIASPSESTPTAGAVTVAPSGTRQLVARGLYSVPPGTKSPAPGLFDCDGFGPSTENCTLGSVAGATFSIDPSTGDSRTFATIDVSGLVTGVRRGSANVRARLAGFSDATRGITVNGPVLKSITFTARDVKNNTALTTAPATVPTGRTIQLTAVATCQSGSGTSEAPATCTNNNYNFSWNLALGTQEGTAEFTPNPPTGQSIAVKTKRFGSFNVEARLTNEEGDLITGATPINASARVLDDIIVTADPAQLTPVPVVKGATTRFIARGLFSDGQLGDISSVDLSKGTGGACVPLTWSADTNAVGQFEIAQSTSCPNAAVLVTSKSANRIGSSGITASGKNSESTALLVEDRVSVDVREVDLLAITKICLLSDAPDQCTSNTQIELSPTPTTAATAQKYVVRGTFRGDAPGLERNIDPAQVPLIFTKGADSSTTGQINFFTDVAPADTVPDSTVSVVGSKTGPARLIATLDSTFAPAISERSKFTDLVVLESSCRDQLFTLNGTTAKVQKTETVGLSEAANADNVIDTNPASFGTYTVGPSVLGGTLKMSFNRPDRVVTSAAADRFVSFVLDDKGVDVKSILSIQTLNAAGAEVESIAAANITRASSIGRAGFFTYSAKTLLPFTGVQLTVKVPMLGGLSPAAGPVGIIGILTSGGSFDIDAYTACVDAH